MMGIFVLILPLYSLRAQVFPGAQALSGRGNIASNTSVVVAGGVLNQAVGSLSLVGGGFENNALGDESFVGGGMKNTASGRTSFTGGGMKDDEAVGLQFTPMLLTLSDLIPITGTRIKFEYDASPPDADNFTTSGDYPNVSYDIEFNPLYLSQMFSVGPFEELSRRRRGVLVFKIKPGTPSKAIAAECHRLGLEIVGYTELDADMELFFIELIEDADDCGLELIRAVLVRPIFANIRDTERLIEESPIHEGADEYEQPNIAVELREPGASPQECGTCRQ